MGCDLGTARNRGNVAPRNNTGGCHSKISSARTKSEGAIVKPRAFAVFALMISSNLVGCSTGRSPGFAPLRILSTKDGARRYISRKLAPYDMTKPASIHSRVTQIVDKRFFAASSA